MRMMKNESVQKIKEMNDVNFIALFRFQKMPTWLDFLVLAAGLTTRSSSSEK